MKIKIKNMVIFIVSLTLGIVLIISPVQAQNKDQKNLNNKTKIIVQYKLIKHKLWNNNNINVEVNNKTITLTGTLPTLSAKNKAVSLAKDVCGKYKIVNNINVAETNLPDSVVVHNVQNRIWNNVFYNVFNYVTVSDSNGVVTLQGWVSEPWYKKYFQKDAEQVKGVKAIVNNIQQTFGPGYLGYRIERMIYGNTTSPLYGMQYFSDPPIHIIVDNNKVILAGNENSSALINWAKDIVIFRTNAIGLSDYFPMSDS